MRADLPYRANIFPGMTEPPELPRNPVRARLDEQAIIARDMLSRPRAANAFSTSACAVWTVAGCRLMRTWSFVGKKAAPSHLGR